MPPTSRTASSTPSAAWQDPGLLLILLGAAAGVVWHASRPLAAVVSGPFLLRGGLALGWHLFWLLLQLAVITTVWLRRPQAYRLLLGWMALALVFSWWEFAGFLFFHEVALPLQERLAGRSLDLGTQSGQLMLKTAGVTLGATLVTLYAWRRRPWFGIGEGSTR
jgi:hypothetical protein